MPTSSSTKSTNSPAAQKTQEVEAGTDTAASASSAETQVAAALGVSEGEVKALRYEAGLDQLAGHEANVHAWEASAQGQEFLKTEKDREKAQKDEDKATDEQTDKDGLDEGAAKYQEALAKARKATK
jgi:hypothetical protein